MNLHHRNVSEIFHVEKCDSNENSEEAPPQLKSQSSSSSDFQATSDNNRLLTETSYHLSHDNEEESINESGTSMKQNIRRWSMNLAKAGKNKRSVYQKTIRFMPSRMTKTMSLDGDLIVTTEGNDIDQITQEIEQRDHLMEDNPLAEQMRIETIKSIPQTLTIKRKIRANVSKTIHRRSSSKTKSITFLKKFKYGLKLGFCRSLKFIKDTITNFEIFYGSMKEIEGHFGSRVSAYFKFLRWLLMLNFMVILLTFWFITFPQILFNSMFNGTEIEGDSRTEFYYSDLFTAEGYFARSILFYGGYANTSFTLVPKTAQYSLPFAYFLTMVCLYLATFILVSISMARSYRRSFIETSGSVQNVITHKIFCSWDFGISNEKAAQLKHASITNELKEILEEMKGNKEMMTKWKEFRIFSAHLAAHLIVVLMIAGVCIGLWKLLSEFGSTEHQNSLSALFISISINSTIVIFQWIFYFISKMESYHQPNTTLNLSLMRNFILEIFIIATLLYFWLTKVQTKCWETSFGQEIYRLIVTDFIISICFTALGQGGRFVVKKYFMDKIDLSEFCIATNSLGLVYNQTLLWVGLLFSPFLAIIVGVKMIILFYIKKICLIYFCNPPSKLWRSSQTQTLFLVLIFVSLLGVIITHGYVMTQVLVSNECGPFRGHDFMFQIFMEGILKLKEEHLFWKIFTLATKPAVFGGILLAMCVTAYYLRAKSKAQIAKVNLLKELLCIEAKDKEFLLANISKITRGKEWVFDNEILNGRKVNDKYHADMSSTWKYEERNGGDEAQRPSTSTSGYQRIESVDEKLRLRRF